MLEAAPDTPNSDNVGSDVDGENVPLSKFPAVSIKGFKLLSTIILITQLYLSSLPTLQACTAVSSSSVLVLSCSKLLARLSISSPENKFHSLVSINSTAKQHRQCLRHYFCYCSPTNGLLIQNWSQFVFQNYHIHVSIRHQRYNSQKNRWCVVSGSEQKRQERSSRVLLLARLALVRILSLEISRGKCVP